MQSQERPAQPGPVLSSVQSGLDLNFCAAVDHGLKTLSPGVSGDSETTGRPLDCCRAGEAAQTAQGPEAEARMQSGPASQAKEAALKTSATKHLPDER